MKYTLSEAGPDSKIYRVGFEISHARVSTRKQGPRQGLVVSVRRFAARWAHLLGLAMVSVAGVVWLMLVP